MEVVRRAQGGDPDALRAIVDDLSAYLARICASIALDARDDALQESLISIVTNLATLRDPAALRAWARTIAVRESLRVVRATRRDVPVAPEEFDGVGIPDGATSVDVEQILASLPPHHRAVLVLRELEGLSEAEVAVALDVSVGTVKSRTSRAKEAFIRRWTA